MLVQQFSRMDTMSIFNTQEKMTGLSLLLTEVMEKSPLGKAKLTSAWPDLSIDLQLEILSEFINQNRIIHTELLEVICDASSPLIKNLAIRNSYLTSEKSVDTLLESKLRNDLDPLIRFALDASYHDRLMGHPIPLEQFLEGSQEQRLAHLSGASAPKGEQFFILMNHLIEQEFDKESLTELIQQYIVNPWVINESTLDEIIQLWLIIPLLSDDDGSLLATGLPTEDNDNEEIPAELVQDLSNNQICNLLGRPDVRLSAFRRAVFNNTNNQYNNLSILTACTSSFLINDNALDALFMGLGDSASNTKDQVYALTYAADLSIPQLMAIEKVLLSRDDDCDAIYAAKAKDNHSNKFNGLAQLKEPSRQSIQNDIATLQLAEQLLPWEEDDINWVEVFSDQRLSSLLSITHCNSTWGLYIELKSLPAEDKAVIFNTIIATYSD